MSKLTLKIALPIIIVGAFTTVVFFATNHESFEPLFYLVLLFLAIYVFFFGLAMGQKVTTPVNKILTGATELSEGNLSSRVYLETKDELADLATIFNKIADELEASRKEQENVEKSVGIKVQAKTKELEEVINALEQKVKNRTVELERLIDESNRLQEIIKSKGGETERIKKELDTFKQKVNKYSKPKQITSAQEEI